MTGNAALLKNSLYDMLSGASSSLLGEVIHNDLQSNYLLSSKFQSSHICDIKLDTNPLSRELLIGSKRLMESLLSVHQFTENRLLL